MRRHLLVYDSRRRKVRRPMIEEARTVALEPSNASRVFLVDDDASVRRALARLLRSAGYDVTAFSSARDFLDNARDDRAACLVLDIRMPGLSGIDLQRELHANDAVLPIIFITGHGDIPTSVKAMKEGAVDFLPKPVKDDDLLKAIEQALARAARQYTEREELERIRSRLDVLTPREREVLEHIVTGQLNK